MIHVKGIDSKYYMKGGDDKTLTALNGLLGTRVSGDTSGDLQA